MNVKFALRAARQILNIFDLDILNFCCNLHTTGNHCAKYEHPWSKHKIGVRVTRYKVR